MKSVRCFCFSGGVATAGGNFEATLARPCLNWSTDTCVHEASTSMLAPGFAAGSNVQKLRLSRSSPSVLVVLFRFRFVISQRIAHLSGIYFSGKSRTYITKQDCSTPDFEPVT